MRVSCWKLREQKHSDTSQKQAWPCGGGLLASSAVSLRFREHISSRTGSEQNKSQVQDPVAFCPWYIVKTDNHSQRNKAKRSPRAHGWTNYLTRWFYANGHDKFLVVLRLILPRNRNGAMWGEGRKTWGDLYRGPKLYNCEMAMRVQPQWTRGKPPFYPVLYSGFFTLILSHGKDCLMVVTMKSKHPLQRSQCSKLALMKEYLFLK